MKLCNLENNNAVFLEINSDRLERVFNDKTNNENCTIVFTDEMIQHDDEFDPALKEALHLITRFGYGMVIPKILEREMA